MPSVTASPVDDFSPELFLVIIGQLPQDLLPSTLLSLGLTCRAIYNSAAFDRDVRLLEDQALSTLDAFCEGELVTEEDIQKRGNTPPSHCTYHLCLDTPTGTSLQVIPSIHFKNSYMAMAYDNTHL